MNEVLNHLVLQNHGIDLSKVLVRLDGRFKVAPSSFQPIHKLVRLDKLNLYVGVPMQKKLIRAFISSGKDVYTKKLRIGLKIEIFEI